MHYNSFMSVVHVRAWLAALVVVVVALASPAEAADGQRRIAVLEIAGARTPRLQQAIAQLVKSRHEVLRSTTYRDAARRRRATRMTPEDIKTVCGFLEIDGVLEGTLSPEAGRYRLILRLRSGKTGAVEWKQGMWLNAPRLSDKMARDLKTRLVAAIDALPGTPASGRPVNPATVGAGAAEVEPPVEEAPVAKPLSKAARDRIQKQEAAAQKRAEQAEKRRLAEEARAGKRGVRPAPVDSGELDEGAVDDPAAAGAAAPGEPTEGRPTVRELDGSADDEVAPPEDDRPRRKLSRGAQDDDEVEDDEVDDTIPVGVGGDDDDDDEGGDDDDKKDRRPSAASIAAVTLQAGLSFTARRLTFVFSGDAADRPPGYAGGMVPGAYASAELYPLGFGARRSFLSRIGVSFMVDRVVKLQSTVPDGMGGVAALPTTAMRWSADARYRQPLGALTATFLVAYSKNSFKIDRSGAPPTVIVDIPNVNYTSLDPGVGLRLDLGRKFALVAEGRAMFLLQTGQIGRADQYGQASALGVNADAGIEVALGERVLLRAGGHLQRIGFDFTGTGEQTDRNNDGTVDVGGATDVFFGGVATVGYLF
jgi:hypothetical protein